MGYQNNRKFSVVLVLALVSALCVPDAYAGPHLKHIRHIASRGSGLLRHTPKAQEKALDRAVKRSISKQQVQRPVLPGTLLPREVYHPQWQTPTVNSLSGRQLRMAARDMRPFLYEFVKKEPEEVYDYRDVAANVMTLGNLTEMSPAQEAKALPDFYEAMEVMSDLSQSLNASIYYLGTSEAPRPSPEQLRSRLDAIDQAQHVVDKARVSWGDDPSLVRANRYLQKVRQFYTMLGTGLYESMAETVEQVVKRPDGHVYEYMEFGLRSEKDVPKSIPNKTLFPKEAQGSLPERMRVAVLQDDEDIINGVLLMKRESGIKWDLDIYRDPETFLQSGLALRYDMVLTDVLIPNGGGRYLARQLRNRGYQGPILTLSGFDASMSGSEFFFEDGIDGMIGLGWTNDWANAIWYHLNNYFLLKEKYGWRH